MRTGLKNNNNIRIFLILVLTFVSTTIMANSQTKPVKVGFVTFLTGVAAVPYGIPARNAARVIIEGINRGEVPPPYADKGFAGVQIEPIFIDENSKQKVADYQQLSKNQGVDLVIGYTSSASCKEIAPVAEAQKVLTVLFNCGTPEVFENVNTNPQYVFRTSSHATMDNVAAAKYVLATNNELLSIAGINQDYAWGQGSWRDFVASMAVLKPKVTISSEQFPKIFAGQYKDEISTVLKQQPDVIHSSFWGGDAESLVIQGGIRNAFSKSLLILTAGDAAVHRLGPQIPDGTIIGARGAGGQMAPESALNDWFKKAYFERFGSFPTYPAYHMAQAIFGVKSAADKVESIRTGSIRVALKGSNFATPSGPVSMALANGHQAITDTAYGSYLYDDKTGRSKLVNIKRYKARCVNPPIGVKSIDWIQSGFKGADCD